MSNACKADGLRNIAAYSHASLVTDGVRTALQSVSQHIVHQVQLYIDTFLCHYSLRSTRWQPSLVFVLLVGEVNHHDTVHDHRQAEDRDRDDHQHEIHGRPRPHTESPFLNTALRFRCLLRLGIGTKCWKGQITATGAKPKTKDVSSRPAFESVVGVVAVGVL